MADQFVTRSADAKWVGPEVTHNPSSIGILATIPAKSMRFALQVIPRGEASDLHRHSHESVHIVVEGTGFSEIAGERVEWRDGDFVYTPPFEWHRHYNLGPNPVRMIVVENTALLQALGIATKESAGNITFAEQTAIEAALVRATSGVDGDSGGSHKREQEK